MPNCFSCLYTIGITESCICKCFGAPAIEKIPTARLLQLAARLNIVIPLPRFLAAAKKTNGSAGEIFEVTRIPNVAEKAKGLRRLYTPSVSPRRPMSDEAGRRKRAMSGAGFGIAEPAVVTIG
jgi:hypothetical protein